MQKIEFEYRQMDEYLRYRQRFLAGVNIGDGTHAAALEHICWQLYQASKTGLKGMFKVS
jgi:hypothetical protein